jgi:large subunit ribosomal protein L17e
MTKTKYGYKVLDENKVAKASVRNAKVSYKNTHETGSTMRGRYVLDAIKYLDDVVLHKQCVPMKRYKGGVGRTSQARQFGTTQGRWPEKSCVLVKSLLRDLKAVAQEKSLDLNKLQIVHFQVNRAPTIHNRTYRAHGRVTAWNKSPCHVEVVAAEREEEVPAAERMEIEE